MRLDNAAKIYPAARSGEWMAVFRLSITLSEEIDRALLQQAIKATLKRIPVFGYRLRRGLFWFYFDRQNAQPRVQEDALNPCMPINLKENQHFLFRIRVHLSRIAVELFHAVADGTGAMTFLLTLAAEYLRLKHGRRIPAGPYVLDCREPADPREWEDSFPVYARKATRARREEVAYPLRGTRGPGDYLKVTTGILDTAALATAAKRYNATVNSFLAGVMLKCMMEIAREDHSPRRSRMPIKLSMPVNLRRYYPSRTLRNFSSYINAPIYPSYGSYSLQDVIDQVKHYAGLETLEPMINARFSGNVAAERSRLLRLAPLFLKTAVLKFMYFLTGERYFSSVLSNMGLIRLPEEMQRHVQRIDFIIGPPKRNPVSMGCVSVGGKTYINFSRSIREPTLERLFFTSLIKEKLHVLIESNRRIDE